MISGEQPIDAIRRTLKYHTGIEAGTVQLFDVLSYVDPDDRRLQYIFIVYLVGLKDRNDKVKLDSGYDMYVWKKKSELQRNVVTNSTKIILDMHESGSNVRQGKNTEKFVIYSDGGSRGNPGPSAAGFVIMDINEDILVEDGRYLGIADSNLAEYGAVYLALIKARSLGLKHIELRSDSLLVVNHLNNIYNNTDMRLEPIRTKIMELMKGFEHIKFVHVRRDFNTMADGIVNKILDSK
jgi:ribonuclease HI